MGAQPTPRAILLDALGTLIELEAPVPRLREELRARLDLDVGEADARRAMRAEMAHYRANLHRASDPERLEELRRECAEVVRGELGLDVDRARVLEALLAALHFTPYPDTVPALGELRHRGIRLVVVSNWDVSLHEVLERTGLDVLVDGAIASAEVGAAKPDPEIFARALALAGVHAREAWHVGDTWEADVEGARAAGLRPVFVDRTGGGAGRDVVTVTSLAELPGLCG